MSVLFINHAPKEINSIYGYRTPMSKKKISINKTTFDSFNPVFIIAQIIVMLLTILLTEIALRKNFDKNGNLK